MHKRLLAAATALALGTALLAAPPAAAHYRTYRPASTGAVPPGFTLSAQQAFAVAERLPAVRAAGHRAGPLVARVFYDSARTWHVRYHSPSAGDQVEVVIDGASGHVLHVWTGIKLDDITRGRFSRIGHDSGGAPITVLVLALLFALPFVDPRRPRRGVHLDVALLLLFLVPYELWRLEHLTLAYTTLFVLTLALIVRLANRRPDREPLVPYATTKLLVAGIVALVAARLALNIADGDASDIGVGTLGGATRFLHGQEIYSRGGGEFDTYGPASYILYSPFALFWPLRNVMAYNPFGVHLAAIVVDAGTGAALFALARRVGRSTLAGTAAAYAWFAYPFTTLTLTINANDALVALTVVGAAAALGSAALAGASLAVAGATKFAPLALAPLHASVAGRHRLRGLLVFALALVVVLAILLGITLPDGGLREFYDVTIGLQNGRNSAMSFWHAVDVDALRKLTMVVVVVFIASLYWVRPTAPKARIFALGAAAIYATQLPLTYWFFTYTVWALPLVLLALCARAD